MRDKILLARIPFFTPLTPPLGIGLLKAFLNDNGYDAECFDCNVDSTLWSMHHKYFSILRGRSVQVSMNEGYSALWWILNAHLLAYCNEATPKQCEKVLETIAPRYGVRYNQALADDLLSLVESFFQRIEELANRFDLSNHAVVGTSTYTTSLASSLYFLKKIKQKWPHIKTVMGGGVFADDLALGSDNLDVLVENYPYIDHIIIGEGEVPFVKLLQGEFGEKRMVTLDDLEGKTLEMNKIPVPDFSDFNMDSYHHLSIEGARSCPFQCFFCSETTQWGQYRKKPKKLFTDHIVEMTKQYNKKSFFMGDSLINPYVKDFSKELLQRDASILYDGYLRADKPVTHREDVIQWARSGLFRVRLGIESAAPHVLELMNKKTSPDTYSKVLKTLADAGIRTTTYWIVGFPGETEEDFQTTLEFIKEHHQYIYELEAHPYYFYPYGQVGSRPYKSYELYPPEITEIIKFKVWEIEDVQPGREERYERHNRICTLCSQLGLPNVYTMEEIYQAEDRWHSLHPISWEVYEGTRPKRVVNDTLATPFPSVFPVDEHVDSSPLVYKVHVEKQLNDSILSKVIPVWVHSNEMLQVRLENNNYVPVPIDSVDTSSILQICTDKKDEQIVNQWKQQLSPESGHSIRVVINQLEEEKNCDVYIIAHRAMVDTSSVALLVEDLFRLYQQECESMDKSLRSIQTTYREWVEKTASSFAGAHTANKNNETNPVLSTKSILLSNDQTKEILETYLIDNEFFTKDLLLSSLISVLHDVDQSVKEWNIDILSNARDDDSALRSTVGPMMRMQSMLYQPTSYRDSYNLLKNLNTLYNNESGTNSNDIQVFINLEYFIQEPWTGRIEWIPQGFIVGDNPSSSQYRLEIIPKLMHDKIEILVHFDSALEAWVESLTSRLIEELNIVSMQCKTYIQNKKYWMSEFNGLLPEIKIETGYGSSQDAASEWKRLDIDLNSNVLKNLKSTYRVDSSVAILSAYSLLLSKLTESEDVILLTSINNDQQSSWLPLRLLPSWKTTCKDYVQHVQHQMVNVASHGNGLEILTKNLIGKKRPVFTAGYLFDENNTDSSNEIECSLLPKDEACEKLQVILQVSQRDGDEVCSILYNSAQLIQTDVEEIASHLILLMKSLTEEDIALGELGTEKTESPVNRVEEVEAFNF